MGLQEMRCSRIAPAEIAGMQLPIVLERNPAIQHDNEK
jgi:hypothetical protein